ncbi:helix-turn-helix domain-containing protein, partial [Vibrio parahaemolyticus]|uniref:helix-turn-helix domain-containing protein n=1 Tax=Vibrio parahaemolyticus TaxID=670 RepID=UPI001D15C16E
MIFNYNLLKPLALLLETKSITATANQMSTSASAVSRTLRSLREIFQDELLTRKNGRMELTPKAIAIRAKLLSLIHIAVPTEPTHISYTGFGLTKKPAKRYLSTVALTERQKSGSPFAMSRQETARSRCTPATPIAA